MSLRQAEIKEWLEWFVENFKPSEFEYGLWIDQDKHDSTDYFANGHAEPVVRKEGNSYYALPTLQLVLQEEIAKKGWYFTLRTSGNYKPTVILRRYKANQEQIVMTTQSRDTILECFMYAFKQAWELTK